MSRYRGASFGGIEFSTGPGPSRSRNSGAAVVLVAICNKDDAAVQDAQWAFAGAAQNGMVGAGWTWVVAPSRPRR